MPFDKLVRGRNSCMSKLAFLDENAGSNPTEGGVSLVVESLNSRSPRKMYRNPTGLIFNMLTAVISVKDGIVSVQDIDIRMKKMFPTAYEIQKIAIDNP